MEDFSFVKFQNTNQRFEDRITITSNYSFGFPTKFFQDNGISNFKYVVVFYDANKKAVGFSFTNSQEEKHKFTILKSKQGYGGSIVATSFFKTYDIEPKKYHGKYKWEKRTVEGIGDLFVITLKEAVPDVPQQPQ